MSIYEFANDVPEQVLWDDMLSYGSRVLLNPPENEAPICYLSPEDADRANLYLKQSGMVEAERIGVGFASSGSGPTTLTSPDFTPFTMLLAPDGVVTSFSLWVDEDLGKLVLTKELIPPDTDEEIHFPEREQTDYFIDRMKFLQVLSHGGAYLATKDERLALLRIFQTIV